METSQVKKTLQEKILCEKFFDYSHFHMLYQVMPVIFNFFEKYQEIKDLKLYFDFKEDRVRNLEIANNYFKFFKINSEFLQKSNGLDSTDIFDNLLTIDCYKNIPSKNFLLYMRSFISDKKEHTYNNIIIQRKINRKIPQDIIDFLVKNYSFKEVFLEDLAFDEQIIVFNNAEFIIAAHGGSLSNIIFCKENTKIVELNSGFNPTCYNDLVKLLFKKINLKIDYRTILPEIFLNQTFPHQTLSLESFLGTNKSNLFKLKNNSFYTVKDISYFKNTPQAFINKNVLECTNFSIDFIIKNLFD